MSEYGNITSDVDYTADQMTPYNSNIMAKDQLTPEETSFTYGTGLIGLNNDRYVSYYRTNEQNSVTGLFDKYGNVISVIEYDEYGNI